VELDEMPLTANGKVDRKALPAPEGERQTEQAYVVPRNDTEQQIAAIWCEVLGVEKVGIDDNFFDLGGNSLLLIWLRSLLAERLQHELQVTDLFGFPTIRTLSEHFARLQIGMETTAEQANLVKVRERARLRRHLLRHRERENRRD